METAVSRTVIRTRCFSGGIEHSLGIPVAQVGGIVMVCLYGDALFCQRLIADCQGERGCRTSL